MSNLHGSHPGTGTSTGDSEDDDRTVVRPPSPSPLRPPLATRPPATAFSNDPEATVVVDPDATRVRPTPPGPPQRPHTITVVQPRRLVAAPTQDDTTLTFGEAHPRTHPRTHPQHDPTEHGSGIQARKAPPTGENTIALPDGFKLHEYRIERLLGQGGFGLTYLAKDVNLNTRVAIKEYLPEDIAYRTSTRTVTARESTHRDRYQHGLDSFLVEARTLATFRHPNIVRVARFFEAHQTAYMVLEYERGSSLKEWWPDHRHLPERELVALLQPLLDGLAVVHSTGVLHRDIKPDNIYVRQEDGSLVLLDFGSARQAVATSTEQYNAFTPGYAPIEQYEGGVQGPWTDVYGLGATLYWMVCGHKPQDANERIFLDRMIPAKERGKGRFTEAFLDAIDWALKPRAADRPQDIAQFRRALFAAHASNLGIAEALSHADGQKGPASWGARTVHALRRIVQPHAWPLAFKMTLAMVLTALLPMAITAWYNLNGSLNTVSASELRNLEQLARSTAGRVSQLVTDSHHLARSIGTDRDFMNFLAWPDDAGKESIRAKLDTLAASNPDIHLLMVMDTQGTAVVSSDANLIGRNFRFRDYFKSAMNGQPYTTGIVVGAAAGQAGMFFSYPVFDGKRQVIGAVVLRLKAAPFAAILEEVRSGAAGDSRRTPMLIDPDGVLIYHPDPKLLYSSLVPLTPEAQAAVKADQRFRRDTVTSLQMPELAKAIAGAREGGNTSYRSTISKEDEIIGFAPVKAHNWVVGVTETRKSFEAPLSELFMHLLISVALVGLLFTGLALRFARSIVQPIRQLTGAADALKAGDFAKAHVNVRRGDEIGQLARTFNVMIDVLRQREREHTRAARRLAQNGIDRVNERANERANDRAAGRDADRTLKK